MVWIFLGAGIAVLFLGAIAGFSPVLYMTQFSLMSIKDRSQKQSRSLLVGLLAGVLLGIIALTIFFQFFQLDALQLFLDSAVHAFIAYIVLNALTGLGFIGAGIWYLTQPASTQLLKPKEQPTNSRGVRALVWLGFMRTFASISGASATFVASGIITTAQTGMVSRLILTGIFLAATMAPFITIAGMIDRHPARTHTIMTWCKNRVQSVNYRILFGWASISLGVIIMLVLYL